jgi:hypothetical protein
MNHPFALELCELEAIDLDFEEYLTDEEATQVGGGRRITSHLDGEGGGEVTTLALGEEGGGGSTTMALGEEGGYATTMALGEEGGDYTT